MNDVREELLRLTGRQVEGQLARRDQLRLREILQSDDGFVELYTDYLFLHGQLTWDAGRSVGLQKPVVQKSIPAAAPMRKRRRLAAVAATILLLISSAIIMSQWNPNSGDVVVQPDDNGGSGNTAKELLAQDSPRTDLGPGEPKPLELKNRAGRTDVVVEDKSADAGPIAAADTTADSAPLKLLPENFTDDMVISRVNELIEEGWQEQNVQPSEVANDGEWMRRVYLTCAGRIPTLDESEAFLADKSPRKRGVLIDQILAAPERADYFATVWTNLMIGRTEQREVNRDKLFEFLAEAFQENTPWIDTVGELITASGRNDKNGATNFLLAHLNDQATPATAVTARLFLGEQISCVQCHDHPFATSGLKQKDYWALNAFFKDTTRVFVDDSQSESAGNKKSRYAVCKLVDERASERMTHFENRAGLQIAVLPKYDGHSIPKESKENRRQLLASLLAGDSDARIAKALVNRMWAHYFGYGFTNPIDDMGPHSTVSHPEVLEILTEAFVRSDYDFRRLSRWIMSTAAWQLSSQTANSVDVPEDGELPLFSRVYPRRMTPEQVYESIRVAIRAASGQPLEHDAGSMEHRRTWVQQFARAYETDENDESLNFEGTIGQALAMMNGSEVDEAIHLASDAIVQNLPEDSESEALERIALAMMTRPPTDVEKRVFRSHFRNLTKVQSSREVMPLAIEDMMWVYLNSGEFVLVH